MTIQTRPAEAPAVPAKTTRDVLLHAALLIEERGWCQRDIEDWDGRVCIVGAVRYAAGDMNRDAPSPRVRGLLAWLRDIVQSKQPLAQWNDEPGRSAAEVVAALRAAADSA